ncbi:MAG: hypothetical protein K2K60_01220 [Clostridia bacterium]|nr:hypothetical protein [Clostridia bacterium]
MKRTSKRTYALAVIIAAIVLLITSIAGGGANFARAATSAPSDVLDDLRKDSSFNLSDYPIKESDYSLQVISIAESTDGELLIYVYQPSGKTTDFRATTIRLSQSTGAGIEPDDYHLTYLNAVGVFYKYKVEGLTIKKDPERYYDITAIHRAYNRLFDDPAGNDNTITEVAYGVGWVWTARTVDGKISYEKTTTEVVEISEKRVGYIRLKDGLTLSAINKACDAHYVAFSTDYNIDKLLSVDVGFDYYTYDERITGKEKRGETQHTVVKPTYKDTASNDNNGLGGKKYNWDRIERAADFVARLDKQGIKLSDEDKAEFLKYDFVLNFYETGYELGENWAWTLLTPWAAFAVNKSSGTRVENVTLLRMGFEMAGKTYNLGVVDNKQTGSRKPTATGDGESCAFLGVPWWGWIIIALLAPLVVFILYKLLTLPFKKRAEAAPTKAKTSRNKKSKPRKKAGKKK